MNIFQQLCQKPWLADPISSDVAIIYPEPAKPAKTALGFFIAVVTIFFFLFSITYLARSQYSDFQSLSSEPWSPLYQNIWLWVNTGGLMLASICLQASAWQASKGQLNSLIALLSLGVIFSVLFVCGQVYVWQQLSMQGFGINTNPANSYFYLLTAIHGLHLVGGLFALARVLVIFARQSESVERIKTELYSSLNLCAWYWHYLLLLWLFLFAMLTAEPSTYNTIAAWCGL